MQKLEHIKHLKSKYDCEITFPCRLVYNYCSLANIAWSSSNGLLGCFCRATEFVAFIKSVAWLALLPEDLYRLARIVAWKIESRGSHEDLYRIAHFVEWRIVSHMRNFYHILRIVAWGILSRCCVRNFIALSREKFYRVVAWGMLSHCRVRNYSHCCVRNFITLLVLSPEKFLLHS